MPHHCLVIAHMHACMHRLAAHIVHIVYPLSECQSFPSNERARAALPVLPLGGAALL